MGNIPFGFELYKTKAAARGRHFGVEVVQIKVAVLAITARMLLTISRAVVIAFPIGFADVFKGQQEQHHLTFLIFNWHNVQEAPEWVS